MSPGLRQTSRPGAPDEKVPAPPAHEAIPAPFPVARVVADAEKENVVSAPAADDVLAAERADHVSSRRADDPVGAVRSDNCAEEAVDDS